MLHLVRRWHRWQDRVHGSLDGSWLHRLFGARIFHRAIWRIDKRSLAHGASLGLFVAFTPTIPFQMLLCTAGSVFLRVNLPIALAGCFVTNPVTALPIYLFARRLGEYLLAESWIRTVTVEVFDIDSRSGRFMEQSLYLWTGCLLLAALAAVVGNVAIRILWRLLRALKISIENQLQDQDGIDAGVAAWQASDGRAEDS